MVPSTFVHFQIPVEDPERAKTFYTQLFGWNITPMPGFGDYWAVMVSDNEADLHGGMQRRDEVVPAPVFYIQVASIDEALDQVPSLGGTVVASKMPVPGMGWTAVFNDTEGNTFGLWQTDPEAI